VNQQFDIKLVASTNIPLPVKYFREGIASTLNHMRRFREKLQRGLGIKFYKCLLIK